MMDFYFMSKINKFKVAVLQLYSFPLNVSIKVHYIVLISLTIMLSWYIETFLIKRGYLKLFFLAFKVEYDVCKSPIIFPPYVRFVIISLAFFFKRP